MEIKKFPNKLRLYRLMNLYSQKKVARLLKLSDTTMLSGWEKGRTYPTMVHLFRLSVIYRVNPFDLYEDLYQHVEKEIEQLIKKEEDKHNTLL